MPRKFKVYPGFSHYQASRTGHFLWCYFFESKDQLVEFAKYAFNVDASDVIGCVISYRKKVEGIRTRELGSMLFYKKQVGPHVISHEATHAAMQWMSAMGFVQSLKKLTTVDEFYKQHNTTHNSPEEKLAHSVGDITGQIYEHMFSKGMLD